MSRTVIIATPNGILLEVLTIILSGLGFNVVGKTSEISNVDDLVIKTKPDLLVFDFLLPSNSKSKYTDVNHLKDQLPQLKIIALGYNETPDQFAKKIVKFGFDGFWNKYNGRAKFIEILNLLFP